MSRRIAVCALSLVLAAAVLVPASSSAQVLPGSRAITERSSWLTALWNQVFEKLFMSSEAGGLIDGNGFASQVGIEPSGRDSDAGGLIDGNGRPTPGIQPGY